MVSSSSILSIITLTQFYFAKAQSNDYVEQSAHSALSLLNSQPVGVLAAGEALSNEKASAATKNVTSEGHDTTKDYDIRFYPTWSEGQLCGTKPKSSFEVWESSYGSLAECCEEAFGWDYDECCESLNMGGC